MGCSLTVTGAGVAHTNSSLISNRDTNNYTIVCVQGKNVDTFLDLDIYNSYT